MQIEPLQRGQAGERASGKRTEIVFVQIEPLQRGQAGEHASGKLAETVTAQIEPLQRGQAGEHASGKRTELVGGLQALLAGPQIERRQRRQAREVVRLQGPDSHILETEMSHAGQLRRRHVGAVRHTVDCSYDRVAHLLGAAADAGRRRHRTRYHLGAGSGGVYRAQLERICHVVGQTHHHEPGLVGTARRAVVDLRPLVGVVAGGLVAVLVARDVRARIRRVPGERHLLLDARRHEAIRLIRRHDRAAARVRPVARALVVGGPHLHVIRRVLQ